MTKKNPIDVDVEFKVLNRDWVHTYSLIFKITLNSPPAKEGFKLKLYWPKNIPVEPDKFLKEDKEEKFTKKKLHYKTYVAEYNNRLYPGDVMKLISPGGITELKYTFNEQVHEKVYQNDIRLYWRLYFADKMPAEDNKSFKDLNDY